MPLDSFVLLLAPFEVPQYGAGTVCSGFSTADLETEGAGGKCFCRYGVI